MDIYLRFPVLHFSHCRSPQVSYTRFYLYTNDKSIGGPRTSERLCGRTCQKCLQPFGKACEQKQLGTSSSSNELDICLPPRISVKTLSWMVKTSFFGSLSGTRLQNFLHSLRHLEIQTQGFCSASTHQNLKCHKKIWWN